MNDEDRLHDAGAIAAAVRARRVTAAAVTEAALARMDRAEPAIHAFCTPMPDQARAAARDIDRRIATGLPVGPLAGVPVAVKDLIMVRGVPTAMGSQLYRDFVPDEDDVVVERLRAADAVILGKTNVSELGYTASGHNALFQTTRNPWNTALTPGGSSAGSAAAVAAGMAPFALGSDGGGSVRIPAALCGVFGMKPSMGRVPLYPGCRDERYPGLSSWESLEHVGPLSRTVADAALMLSVIAGPDGRDRHSLPAADFDWQAQRGPIRGLRVAYSADLGYATVDAEVARICAQAAAVFERDLGCVVEAANPGWSDPWAAFAALEAMETDLVGLRALVASQNVPVSPALTTLLARHWTATEFTDAIVARKAVCNAMARLMARYDLLLTPTVAAQAFAAELDAPPGVEDWAPFTYPMNMTGQPASSVVAGKTAAGLPVGLQIVGRHLDDAVVLRASAAFEQARPWDLSPFA